MLVVVFIATPTFASPPDEVRSNDIATQVPEFAGLYYSGSSLVINMTKDTPELREKITTIIRQQIDADAPLVFNTVQYSFKELEEWHDLIYEKVWSYPFVTATSINEQHDYIKIGVKSEKNIQTLREALNDIKIPQDAVAIEVEAPFTIDPLITKSKFPIWGFIGLSVVEVLGIIFWFLLPKKNKH